MACLPHTATDVGLCPSPSLIHAYHWGPSCASPTVRTSLNGLQTCHDPESWYLLFLLSGTLLNIPGMTAGTYRPPSGRNNKMRWQRLARGGTLCLSLVPPYLKRLGQVDDIDARIWYPPGRHHRGLCESKLVGCSSHPPGTSHGARTGAPAGDLWAKEWTKVRVYFATPSFHLFFGDAGFSFNIENPY